LSQADFLQIAKIAAREAGQLILKKSGAAEEVRMKGLADPVTEVDLASEQLIRGILKDAFPEHDFLGEEQGLQGDRDGFLWIVDPIDGTKNFIRGLPHFCVSVALVKDGVPIVGAVYEPNREEMYWALRGEGAFLNGHPVRVSNTATLSDAILISGFAQSSWNRVDLYKEMHGACLENCLTLRRTGSAALDLCYVAAGRTDGYWQFGLSPWDVAAGILLVEEAGGRVIDIEGDRHDLWSNSLIATNTLLEAPLKELLLTHYQE